MARETGTKVHSITLSAFLRYLDEKRRELEACYKEIEEVQFQFNDIFKQELAGWQQQFAFCLPRVATQRDQLPPEFVQKIDDTIAEERAKLLQEIADLQKEVAEKQRTADDLLAQAQKSNTDLRAANPEIDQQEEQLKAEMVRLQDEYAAAYEQLEALNTFPLGWLSHMGRISALRKQQGTIKKQQNDTLIKLRQLRQGWLDRVQQVGDTQSDYRQKWQEHAVRISEAKARVDHLAANLDALAEEKGLQRVLETLDKAPVVSGELGAGLVDLVRRNQVRRDYEQGLRAVAEALGLTKGVGEGMKRFQKSVETVVQEQRRYSLKEVDVGLPEWVIGLNETWKHLRDRVKDEKYMGVNPVEFSVIVTKFISERLTNDAIQALFETMGESLNRATAAWK
ncbi:MAG: coiled-coil domain-containing protein [Anaerolineae bacterium]